MKAKIKKEYYDTAINEILKPMGYELITVSKILGEFHQVKRKTRDFSELIIREKRVIFKNDILDFKKNNLKSGMLYKPSKIKNGKVICHKTIKNVFDEGEYTFVKNGHVLTKRGHYIKTDENFEYVKPC